MNATKRWSAGDNVEWVSQSNGRTAVKRGTVETVVPARAAPPPISKNRNPGMPRDHESYLVRVKGRGLYWPRVAALRDFIDAEEV
jgi:hypothetical protein